MELRGNLEFSKATIGGLERYPADNGPSCIMALEAVLSVELATALGRRESVFDHNGVPHQWEGSTRWGEQMRNVELCIGTGRKHGWTVKPSVILGFAVKHRKAKDGDTTVILTMRFHLAGEDAVAANNFLDKMNKDEFGYSIEPLQGALFDIGAGKNVGDALAAEAAGVQ